MAMVQELISSQAIQSKVSELAGQIRRDYLGQSLLVVGILKGAFVFTADLVRALGDMEMEVDFMAVSSYGTATETSGTVRILKDLDTPVAGRHVLLVEDILDTGLTLRYLRDYLSRQGPLSLRVCVLLDKPSRRKVEAGAEYVGFTIPDQFVVGYGIDWAERYRNLPFVGVVQE